MQDQIIFNAVGDVWFGDHPVCFGHGVNSTARRLGPDFFFSEVSRILEDGHVNFCNLESTLSERGLKRWLLPSSEMRGFPACAKALSNAGFNVVSVANNHALQHGLDAFWDTLEILGDNRIAAVGIEGPCGSNLLIIERNSLQLGIISFSLHPEQYFRGSLPYSYRSVARNILEEIQQIRKNFDGIMVVSLHWGSEFIHFPSSDQVCLAHQIVDAGVSAVLGHHPHVLQGIEEYGGGLIAYSLGNFVFDLWEQSCRESIILRFSINCEGISNYSAIPVYIGDNYQPETPSTAKACQILRNISKYGRWIEEKSLRNDEIEYSRISKVAESRFRVASYLYFIKNIWRYRLNITLQTILRTVCRKFLASYGFLKYGKYRPVD